jgi:hypothetical protein
MRSYLDLSQLVSSLKLKSVDVIKIYIEGAGLRMIKGELNAIRNFKPVIFFEVHNDDERLAISQIKEIGYDTIESGGDMFILIPHLN